ncbi:hypothetical protein BVG19_g4934 [[Candida] boidinii]|nr:hypothetical protein BVG19_g4934 [[Candida] boidinii]OWB53531.1 hypothetical protein B5S27_g5132 [[Candida] boidinii]
MFRKLKQKISGTIPLAAPAAPEGAAPTKRSIYQSRLNFGVNFGSLFVQEKWIFEDCFPNGTGYELDGIRELVKTKGEDETRNMLESHWKGYCNDDDWNYLKSKGVTCIRIPIGYWIIDGGKFTSGTNFHKVRSVYKNAWNILKENYIKKAADYDIAIIVDIHGLPKGANTADHSGEKFDTPGFFDDGDAIDLICDACKFIVSDLEGFDNFAALQIINESVFSNDGSGQKHYYRKAITAIRSVNKEIPVVISDGWWVEQWVNWINEQENKSHGDLGIILDTHIYRCFSDDDKSKSAPDIINGLGGTVLNDSNLKERSDIMIGEYSCVLDGNTWNCTHGDRNDIVRHYGNTQSDIFNQRSNCGYFFWTYKFKWGDGGEWGFRPMVDRQCIRAPPPPKIDPNSVNEDLFNDYLNKALQGQQVKEEWRFKEGFTTSWADCLEFAKFNNSKLGRLHAWKNSRRNEHIRARGSDGNVFDWDLGFNSAASLF